MMGDLIDRDAALASIEAALNNATGDLYDAYAAIRALPAVTVGVVCTWPSCGHTARGQCLPTTRLAALEPVAAAHVNETPKAEHDGADVLTAAQAREAALREAAASVRAGDTVQAIQRRILALIDKEPGNG